MDESACVCVCGGDGRGGVPSSTLPQGHTTVISDQIKPHQTHRIKECAAVTVCTKSLTSRPETPPPTHTHAPTHPLMHRYTFPSCCLHSTFTFPITPVFDLFLSADLLHPLQTFEPHTEHRHPSPLAHNLQALNKVAG